MSIRAKQLKQICIAAWNLDEKQEKWDKLLGMKGTRTCTPFFDHTPSFTDGKPDTFGDTADILFYELEDGMILEFMGPGEGDTPWRRYLDKHGEGVMYIGFYVTDRKKVYEEIGKVCQAKGPYHIGYYPDTTYSFVDTSTDLGVQLNIKELEDNTSLIQNLVQDPSSFDENY